MAKIKIERPRHIAQEACEIVDDRRKKDQATCLSYSEVGKIVGSFYEQICSYYEAEIEKIWQCSSITPPINEEILQELKKITHEVRMIRAYKGV